MITCKNCLLPETHETITFNQNSVCNICTNQKPKKRLIGRKKKLN